MTDRDALLAAILANPNEDTPRLAYADLIQEAGEEERAEFIRVQCELARMKVRPRLRCQITSWVVPNRGPIRGEAVVFGGQDEFSRLRTDKSRELVDLVSGNRDDTDFEVIGAACDWELRMSESGIVDVTCRFVVTGKPDPNRSRHDDLAKRQQHLSATHGDEWVPQAAVGRVRWRWVRGFVQEVICDAADWLAHADAILKQHPVRKVVLTTHPTSAERQSRKKFKGLSEWMRFVHKYSGPDGTEKFLKDYWPGIEFELPLMPHTLSGTVRIAGELLADSVLNVAPIIPPGYINT